jgi:hypothetical protein
VALRRAAVLVALTGAIALAWALLSPTARPASAKETCTRVDISGTWNFAIAGHQYSVRFRQGKAGNLTGELTFSSSEVAEFGYPPGTRFPITKGTMDGDRLVFEETPTNSKTDGTGAHVGVYNGTVKKAVGPGHGTISGNEYDKQVPSSRASFTGRGPAACLSWQLGPPEVAPPATNWNTPVSVQAKPGSDTAVSSPPLGNASRASATANGVTDQDLLVAEVALKTSLGTLKRTCLLRFAWSLRGKVIETDLLGKLDATYADLAYCLALADAIDAYRNAHPAAAQAGTSACAQAQIAVSPHGARRRTVHVTHVGPIPNVPVRATCTVGAGRATIAVSSNKHGTPLRKLIGPRLQIGLFRSRRDAPGGQVTVRFARR